MGMGKFRQIEDARTQIIWQGVVPVGDVARQNSPHLAIVVDGAAEVRKPPPALSGRADQLAGDPDEDVVLGASCSAGRRGGLAVGALCQGKDLL